MSQSRIKVGLAALLGLTLAIAGCDKPAEKPAGGTTSTANKKLVVGFSQVGAESAWRTANTEDIKAEAAKRGIDLRFSDAQQKQENQIKAIRGFIAQNVDVIAFSAIVKTGFDDVLKEAKDAGIPVVLSDRGVTVADDSLYVAFVGADFVEEGRRAGRFVVEKTGGKAVIAELTGEPGADPMLERQKGFAEVIAGHPDMKIVVSQTGMWTRAKGREVMESFLKGPQGNEINVLFAHNDDMALGAIQAIEAAGKVPGKDIMIVSIDGVKDALQAIVDGKIACSVECSPLMASTLFDVIEKVARGESVPKRVVVPGTVFTIENAAAALPDRKY